jgi:hypothetical protein
MMNVKGRWKPGWMIQHYQPLKAVHDKFLVVDGDGGDVDF